MSSDPLCGAAALLLDWDGTLADTTSSNYTRLCAILSAHGIGVGRAWYNKQAGLALADLLDALRTTHPAVPGTAQLVAQCRELRLADPGPVTAIPATIALLGQARRRGLPCAIASGAVTDIVHAGITALGLRGHFSAVITRGDVAAGRPAPDLFAAAAARLDVAPGLCAAVDDAPDGSFANCAYCGHPLAWLTADTGLRSCHDYTGVDAEPEHHHCEGCAQPGTRMMMIALSGCSTRHCTNGDGATCSLRDNRAAHGECQDPSPNSPRSSLSEPSRAASTLSGLSSTCSVSSVTGSPTQPRC